MARVNKKCKQQGPLVLLCFVPENQPRTRFLASDVTLTFLVFRHLECCLCDLFHTLLYNLSRIGPLRNLDGLFNELLYFRWSDWVGLYELPLAVYQFQQEWSTRVDGRCLPWTYRKISRRVSISSPYLDNHGPIRVVFIYESVILKCGTPWFCFYWWEKIT